MNFAIIGLGVIVISWIVQLLSKKKNLNSWFVIIYMAGVILLVYDGFSSGMTSLAWMNLVSLIASFLVFLKLILKK